MAPLLLAPWLLFVPLPEAKPPLTDLNVFAPHAAVCVQFDTAASHNSWITGQRLNTRQSECPELYGWLRDWESDADWCVGCWGLLCGATNPAFDEAHRRDCLRRLREELGPEAYYSGRMPPPVPLWRFARR